MLKLSNLEMLLLSALIRGEDYGLGLVETVKEQSQGKVKVSMGSLYPTLYRMEKKGLVKSRWGDDRPEERAGARRRYYRMTGQGEHALKEAQTTFSQMWGLIPEGVSCVV